MNATETDRIDRDTDLYWDYVKYEENEILVARQYEGLVIKALRGLGIRDLPGKSKSSPLLGLTLLAFEEPRDAVKDRLAGVEGAIPGDLVGMVLNAVKNWFTEGAPGRWIPTMGRNRLVGHVDGTNGNVIVGGNDPKLAPFEAFPPNVRPASGQRPGPVGTGPGVRVAVIDTVLGPHPFLEGKWVAPNPSPFDANSRPHFRAGHGTFVAGIVLAQAPDAAVTVHPALNSDGRATSWEIANAILDSAHAGAQIINLSLACYTLDGLPPLVFTQAISRLPPGTLVVAAAGNMANQHPPAQYDGVVPDLSQAPAWPAALDNVVAVGAADPETVGQSADFSPAAPWVDVRAPGVEVFSIFPGGITSDWPVPQGGIAKWSGTSFATAHVTGAVAAIASAGNLSPRDAYIALLKKPPKELDFLASEI